MPEAGQSYDLVTFSTLKKLTEIERADAEEQTIDKGTEIQHSRPVGPVD